jgi:GPI-anchor transamidase subunit T
LKPKSVCTVYFKAEYAFLKWDEYPPDVNHGFHLNPALISFKLPESANYPEYKPFNVFSSLFDM